LRAMMKQAKLIRSVSREKTPKRMNNHLEILLLSCIYRG
jgi:hypothetical protein